MSRNDIRYTWRELQEAFPEQWCGLIDVVKGDDRQVPFQSAILLCHGKDRHDVGDRFEEMEGNSRMLIYTNLNHAYMLGGGVLV
ncbi:MAG: hypothetical protein IJT00_05750 [Lachnospiraceae bacterium]|nr:hypothetical protein [Lachnospiraceae bacterium]